ncbi:hypothetical protein [Gimesia aquarii]|uniref:Uncharacterized protein n=1 Tax=Gimesia aquarii TaxID=2527964 RepID=A0A517VZW3_9PLAN|nr:hypothetical protein [Gimesia aquarii]QDT98539.1 hypothetical protein V144x_40460 [Gimesia aquarii]
MNEPLTRETGKSTLVKPRFGPGMLLQHEDLEAQTAYTQELSRLLLRSLLGCGVVCGLEVEEPHNRTTSNELINVKVKKGVALNCLGDLIHVPKDVEVSVNISDIGSRGEINLWVVLCRTTINCGTRNTMCPDDNQPKAIPTREYDGYEIGIYKKSSNDEFNCKCGDGNCYVILAVLKNKNGNWTRHYKAQMPGSNDGSEARVHVNLFNRIKDELKEEIRNENNKQNTGGE